MTKVEGILKNTDTKTLFELFKKYTDRLVEQCEGQGIFCVDEGDPVFTDNNIRNAIKEIKN